MTNYTPLIAEALETFAQMQRAISKIALDFPEAVRTDHPLLGQTFSGLSDAIEKAGGDISDGLKELASAIRELKK